MRKFWKNLGIKTVKTMAQAALAVIPTTALLSELDLRVIISTTVVAGIVCVLMNISQLEVNE